MIQLFINNVEIDIDELVDIPLNYSQSDVKNPETRKRDYSKDIKLPGTKNNNAFFMSAYNLYISDVYGDMVGFDFDPTLRYPARLLRNGKPIFSGTTNLNRVVTKSDITNGRQNEFYINIFAEITELFQSLGDIKVNELDWSDYDHVLNVTNIVNSWSAIVGNGYFYPYIQFGFSQDPLKIKTNQLRPYVYLKEIVEKCFAYAGFTVLGGFFDNALIKKITWGSGGGEMITINTTQKNQRLVNFDGDGSGNFTRPNSRIELAGIGTFYTVFSSGKQFNFSDNDVITIFQVQDILGQMNEDTGEIIIANTGNYVLDITSELTLAFDGTIATALAKYFVITTTLRIIVNGASVASIENVINTDTAGTQGFDLNMIQELDLNSGDIVQVYFFVSNSGSKFFMGAGGNLSIDVSFDAITVQLRATNSIIVDGDTINLSRFLPDMKCSDFLKDVITIFNLYLSDPDQDGGVTVLPERSYFFGTDDTDNWTDKLDRGSEIEIKSASLIEGKTYRFRFAEDRDYYKKLYFDTYGNDYGDYNYDVPSTWKKGDKIYQLQTAQSCPVQIEATDIVIPHIFQMEESTGVVKPHKGKPRMFFNNGTKSTSVGWKLVNSDTGAESTQSVYPVAHHLDNLTTATFDLNFGVPTIVYYNATTYTTENLFYKYYAQFIRQLVGRDSKIVNAWFKLNEGDFYKNFMRRLVNIDGVLYRKNAIKDYLANSNSLVKVELLKILDGNSRTMQGLESLPVGFTPRSQGTGDGQVYVGNLTARSNQTYYQFDTSGGNIQVQLTARSLANPFLGSPYGKIYVFKKISGSGNVIINAVQGATIDGAGTYVLSSNNQSVTLILEGSSGNYKVIG